jgi:phosphate transport system permease protein
MGIWSFSVFVLIIATIAYWYGNTKAIRLNSSLTRESQLPSLPKYYGENAVIWLVIPSLLGLLCWLIIKPHIIDNLLFSFLSPEIKKEFVGGTQMLVDRVKSINIKSPFPGTDQRLIDAAIYYDKISSSLKAYALWIVLGISSLLCLFSLRKIGPKFRARQSVEQSNIYILILCSVIAIITTVGIVFSLIFESLRFFDQIPILDFLLGLSWSPQMAIREDQIASQGSFGAVPIFAGTLLITLIAMFVSIPIGLTSAIYLSEYASPSIRTIIKPLLEILAGVPTVVYGFFAAITVGPFFRELANFLGFNIASESAIAAGGVMGIMIIPFISSLSDDVISAVPQSLRDGSYAMGATKSETIKRVILPAALPGIVGAVLLAISRAIGETMIVVMAAGIAANLTANPFEAVTTVTVQIVTLLVGDQEFDSTKTLAAFALGITLFVITLILNLLALKIVHKYRERYE